MLLDDDNRTDVDDTVKKMADGDVGEALKDDYEQTKEDVKDAAEKAGNTVENGAERAGVNEGDPNRNDD